MIGCLAMPARRGICLNEASSAQVPCPSPRQVYCPRQPQDYGHTCKRPFACAVTNCMICPRATEIGQYACRVPFWAGISGSKPPSLAIPTAIAPEKGRFALEIWNSRKAAIHDAGSGGPAAALTPRPGTGGHTRPLGCARRPLAHPSAFVTAAYPGLHIESELSGPKPHFSGAMV
jgi:hypothetical protein